MKKHFSRILTFLLAFTICFSVLGCDVPDSGNSVVGEISVWSQTSSVNIMRNIEYADSFKGDAEYKVSGGRGEYEAAQLIVTAPKGKIANYTIEVSDLVCGDDKIDKSYISVYNEKYLEVISTSATYSSGLGWYADALLPYETAVEYNENTVGSKDEIRNQGLYIETFIPRSAPAGEYKGTFKLTVDGKNYTIPASVTVHDFEVDQESHLQSDWIVNLRGFGDLNTTKEMGYNYFEFVAGHRASTHSMSMGYTLDKDGEKWIETIRKYTNPNLRDEHGNRLIGEKESYLAQINIGGSYDTNNGINLTTHDSYLSTLIAMSIADNYDYLAKTGAYTGFIDEPHYNGTWDKVNQVTEAWYTRNAHWANIVETADLAKINASSKLKLTQEQLDNASASFMQELAKSTALVANYMTATLDERLDPEWSRQFCSGSYLSSAKNLYTIENWTDKENTGNWWYAAGDGRFGNRIDSEPVEQKLSSWYTYARDAQGYLIWETAQYQEIRWNTDARANAYTPCDPYTLARRISNGNGDGFILYPGKPYGLDTPVSSIRAVAYRDASEEYEYFYLLEKLYTDAGYSADAVLNRIFASLYNETSVTEDISAYEKQREQVINLILLAKKDVFVTDYTDREAKATLTVVSTGNENIVKVNGESVTAAKTANAVHDMTTANKNLSFVTDSGLSFTMYLGGKAERIDGLTASEYTVRGGTVAASTLGETPSVKFDFTFDSTVNDYDFTFDADKNDISSDTKFLFASFYNHTSEPILVECWFVGTDARTTYVDDVLLNEGYNTIYIGELEDVKWSTIRRLTGVRFKVLPFNDIAEYSMSFTGLYAIN